MLKSLLLFLLPLSAWAYDWTCNLHCYNQGECRHGKGKFGSYAGVEDDTVLPWEKTTPTVGMYCACPVGYTGLQCEIHMNICGSDEHTCFNGSTCAKERTGDGKVWWRCECDLAESVMTAEYAGKYCEHISTIFCGETNAEDFGNHGTSYCTNGGKCKEKDHEGQKHVGCICLDGYEGEHCEINKNAKALTLNDIAVAATSDKSVGLIMVLVIGGVAVALFFLWFYDRREKKKRRKKRLQNAGIQSSFRTNQTGEVI